jgi:hypothetical protein
MHPKCIVVPQGQRKERDEHPSRRRRMTKASKASQSHDPGRRTRAAVSSLAAIAVLTIIVVAALSVGGYSLLKAESGTGSAQSATATTSSASDNLQQIDYDWHHLSLLSPSVTSSPSLETPAVCSSIGLYQVCGFYGSPGSQVSYGVTVSSNLTQAVSIEVIVNETVTTFDNSSVSGTSSTSQLSTSTITIPKDGSAYPVSGVFTLPADTTHLDQQGVDFGLKEGVSGITLIVGIVYSVTVAA